MWLNVISITLVVALNVTVFCQGAPMENTVESNHRNKRSIYDFADENPWRDYLNEDDDVIDYTLYPDEAFDNSRTYPDVLRLQYLLRALLSNVAQPGYFGKRDGGVQEPPIRGIRPNPIRSGSLRPYNKCKRGKGGAGTWLYGC
ncbi:uncharacterized protein [Ptychodera flava]|uniref:uncharacterized protein n=1 Tax=Ptychodera flava TaxID=63121 RepID=UPI00396AA717